jgi:hypothetical protein
MLAPLLAAPLHAAELEAAFPQLQKACVQTPAIRFGAKARWASCEVTHARWFVTLDFLDQYQTQYCLGKRGQTCEKRALLVFANRAYTPTARLLLQQVDAGDTEYDDPLVVGTTDGTVMLLTSRRPGSADRHRYYQWQGTRWTALDSQAWQRDLTRRLPPGSRIKTSAAPDISSMSARVVLTSADAAAPEREISVPLRLSGGRLVMAPLPPQQTLDP